MYASDSHYGFETPGKIGDSRRGFEIPCETADSQCGFETSGKRAAGRMRFVQPAADRLNTYMESEL